MAWTSPITYADAQVPTGAEFNTYIGDNPKFLHGSQAGQTAVVHEARTEADSFEFDVALPQIIKGFSTSSAQFRFVGENKDSPSAVSAGEKVRIVAVVGERDGATSEPLGVLEATLASAGTSTASLRNYSGGALAATSAVFLDSDNDVGINQNAAAYDLDVAGQVKAERFLEGGLTIGQWTNSPVTLPVFTGSGLDDLTTGTTFTGSGTLSYVVEIDGTGAPDTFRWSDDGGGTWDASTVAITGAAQTLNNGVTVTFAATTGHTSGDSWAFSASSSVYTMRFEGSAAVTGQLISTQATGTAPLEVKSSTKVANLNAALLQGYDWPSSALQASKTTNVTVGDTATTLVSVTTERAGWHLILAEAHVLYPSGGLPGTFLMVPGGGEFGGATGGAFGQTASAGDRIHIVNVGLYQATAAEVLSATVRDGEGGVLTAQGSILALWLVPS